MLSPSTEKWIHRFDWIIAIATAGYGVWQQSLVWEGMGVLALLLAWWNPAARFRTWIQKKVLRRQETEQWRKSPRGDTTPETLSPVPAGLEPPSSTTIPQYLWTSPASFRPKQKPE